MMLITLPFFMPLVQQLGVDPIWFGVLFLICMQLGLLTPPFGLLLFTMKGVAPPGITMNDVFQAALPYVWFGLLVLVLVFFFPPLATWLPGLLGLTSDCARRKGNVRIDKSPGGRMTGTISRSAVAHRCARRRPRLLRRRLGAGLADAAGDDGRALRARRQHRPGRPRVRPRVVREARPAVHRREQGRGRRLDRRGGGGEVEARRLHAAGDGERARRPQQDALRVAALRSGHRFHADLADQRRAAGVHRQSEVAGRTI